jgi:hypothetical protein
MATSKKPNIQEGETVREMTDAEFEQWQTDNAKAQARVEAEAEAAEAKQVARQALLDRLGLTEQEAQLLLGS